MLPKPLLERFLNLRHYFLVLLAYWDSFGADAKDKLHL